MKDTSLCNVEDCNTIVKMRGLCNSHYRKWLRGADLPVSPKKSDLRPKVCTQKGCDGPVVGNGFCLMHYTRSINGYDMEAASRFKNKGKKCLNPECEKEAYVKGLCKACYKRQRVHGDFNYKRPELLKNKKITSSGYVKWYDPDCIHSMSDGMVLEHRYIIGEEIGRRLTREENVHHKDGNRANNKRENLELWNTSQPPGQRVEDKIKWAKEIIKMYENIELINQ